MAEKQPTQEKNIKENPIPTTGIPLADLADILRSEPALAWFLAQGMWFSQPVLELFWSQDQIAQVAELLESVRRSAAGQQTAGGKRQERTE